MRLPAGIALVRRSAAEYLFDRVKLGDAHEGLAGNRSWRRCSLTIDLHKLAPQMRPAEGERPRTGRPHASLGSWSCKPDSRRSG